jgi:CBS-domain-containing membrane protein
VSAVAVLDAENHIVDNISTHDMQTLILDPSKFLGLRHEIGSSAFKLHEPSAITCKPSDTIETVLRQLCANYVHRVYVVDEQKHPVGVVSLRDIIACFVKEPKDSELWKFFSTGPVSHSSKS